MMDNSSRSALLVQLLQRLSPEDPNADPGASVWQQRKRLQLALQMMDSTLGQPPDEATLLASIRRELDERGSNEYARCADLHNELIRRVPHKTRSGILCMLLRVSKDACGRSFPAPHSSMASMLGKAPQLSTAIRSSVVTESSTAASIVNGDESFSSTYRGQELVVASARADQVMAAPRANALIAAQMENTDFEVPEESLVKSVMYAIQGIDSKYSRYVQRNGVSFFEIDPSYGVPKTHRVLMKQLCELGWLYKKVQTHAMTAISAEGGIIHGAVRQAFCGALQAELAEYFRLIANLEARTQFPIPSGPNFSGSGDPAPYLTLRRLQLSLAAPLQILRTLASLSDSIRGLKGGAMASAIYKCTLHGDPFHHQLVSRVLTAVCRPLYGMLEKWMLEGQLDDFYKEFFIIKDPEGAARDLWREGYVLDETQLPPMVTRDLAARILRCGKSIIFLRECCGDNSWVPSGAGSRHQAKLEYGQEKLLEQMVRQACEDVNSRLMSCLFERFNFFLHCEAIRRYMLTAQGDFISCLIDSMKDVLQQPASYLLKSEHMLAGKLEAAIRASNAQYEEPEVLDCLAIKCIKAVGSGECGKDVFSISYELPEPLSTVFTPDAMLAYKRIFKLLWDVKCAEHDLAEAWHTVKPNSKHNKHHTGRTAPLWQDLRRQMSLRNDMSHFVTNLQYYFVFEVLEGGRDVFINSARGARDLDELIAAHNTYLQTALRKTLLDGESQHLHAVLYQLFDVMHRFAQLVQRLNAAIETGETLAQQGEQLSTRKAWGAEKKDYPIPDQELRKFMDELDTVHNDYNAQLNSFVALLPTQAHVDLRFLKMRLDFTNFYNRGFEDESDDSAPTTPN